MYRMLIVMLIVILFLLAGLAGCTRQPEVPEAKTFDRAAVTYVLALNLDLSTSNLKVMDDIGWRFVSRLLKQYFRDRDLEFDQIILSQLSGDPGQGPIWKGSPRDFHRRFGSGAAFKDYLAKYSPYGSRLYASISESLSYATRHAGPNAKLLLVALSDLEDNASPAGAEAQLVRDLENFSRLNGRVGFYGLAPHAAKVWEERLRTMFPGDRYLVTDAIEDNPKLPNTD